MKRNKIAAIVIGLTLFASTAFAMSFECRYARYNPTYAAVCVIQLMADMIYGGGWGSSGDADGLGG